MYSSCLEYKDSSDLFSIKSLTAVLNHTAKKYVKPGWISRLAESRDREIGRKVSPTTPLKYRQWGRALSYIRGLFPSATGGGRRHV